MAFFEDLGRKISKTSQGVVQKTKDTAEVMKLNSMISDEEKHMNTLFLEIGKRYFELHSDSFEPQFESLMVGVKASKSKVEQYSEQIKRLKGVVRCPNCGADVQYGSPFCSTCGSRVETNNEQQGVQASNVRRCVFCGSPISDGCAFCTHCGTKVDEQTAPMPEPAPAPAPTQTPDPTTVVAPEPATVVVQEPAFVAPEPQPEQQFVKAPDPTPTPASAVSFSAPTVRVCPVCGHTIADGNVFCTNCGTKV